MGLLSNVLLAPVTLPVRGLNFVFREVQKAADQELNDPDVIRRELLELQRRLDAGLIDEATYDQAEAELLGRLNAIAERRRAADAQAGADQDWV
jgi:cytochrome c-type biogenesis protein CcmH/NrfG